MSFQRALFLTVVALLVLAQACGETAISEGEERALVLGRTEGFPCTLEFVSEGVSLTSDLEGAAPDPGAWIAWAPEERAYLTSVPGGGEVAVWSDDGRFLRMIGRPGQGPGELGISAVPFVDPEGEVHVFDAVGGKWSRFSFAGEFLGSTSSPQLHQVFYPNASALVGTSTVLISQVSPLSPSPRQFRLLDTDGSLLHEFGDLPPHGRADRLRRAIAYKGDGSFWAAPYDGDPYVLEEWSLEGRLLRTIRREAPGPPDPERGLPRYRLSAGEGGRLLVLIIGDLPEPGNPDPAELWYEVLDPDLSEVLASRRILFEDPKGIEAPPQFGIAPGSSLGFRAARGELDLAILEVIRYVLTPSPDADPEHAALCSP